MRAKQPPIPPGAIRECVQFDPRFPHFFHYQWDLQFKDPGSGRIEQFTCEALVQSGVSVEEFDKRIRSPSVACLTRMVNQKCGTRAAVFGSLTLPRGISARYL